jgi:hypothetical protein
MTIRMRWIRMLSTAPIKVVQIFMLLLFLQSLMDNLGTMPLTKHAAQINESISYLHLPPSLWARIQADNNIQPLPLMIDTLSIIGLDDSSSCSCCSPWTKFDSRRPVETHQCYVYGILNGHCISIDVQKCPHCPQGYIGPECTALGIFNLNNCSLFTLALLDDYTAHFT